MREKESEEYFLIASFYNCSFYTSGVVECGGSRVDGIIMNRPKIDMGNSMNHRKSKSGLSSKNAGKVSLESNEEFAPPSFFPCFVRFLEE